MAKTNSTASPQSAPEALENELNAIAARLAGVEEILLELVESPEGGGNTLHLMAEVVANANHEICIAADRVSKLRSPEAAK